MENNNGKKLVITGFVLGIVSCAISYVGSGEYAGLVSSIVGIVLGIVGLVLTIKGKKALAAIGQKSGLAVAGMILSIVGIVLSAISLIACTLCVVCFASALNDPTLQSSVKEALESATITIG